MPDSDTPGDQSSDLRRELAYEIGALFLNFGTFEHMLNETLAAVLGLNEQQRRVLIASMQARNKLELLESYANKHWTVQARSIVKKIVSPAKKMAEFRNDIAHGAPAMRTDHEHIHLIHFRGKHRYDGQAKELTPKGVRHYSQLAVVLSYQLKLLADRAAKDRAKIVDEIKQKRPPK